MVSTCSPSTARGRRSPNARQREQVDIKSNNSTIKPLTFFSLPRLYLGLQLGNLSLQVSDLVRFCPGCAWKRSRAEQGRVEVTSRDSGATTQVKKPIRTCATQSQKTPEAQSINQSVRHSYPAAANENKIKYTHPSQQAGTNRQQRPHIHTQPPATQHATI